MPHRIDQIGRLVSANARATPTLPAFKDRRGGARSYAEVESRTNRLANALLGAGLSRGDRVGAWLADAIEYLELYVAVAKAGLVLVPVNAHYTPDEAAYMLADADARALVFDAVLAEAASVATKQAPVRLAVVVGHPVVGARDFEAFLSGGADRVPAVPDEDDPLMIGYTSGTTGRPKGAVLTHRSVKSIARMNAVSYRQPRHAVCLYSASMAFVATIAGWVGTFLLLGGTIVLTGRWETDDLVEAVRDERATFAYVPSPLLEELAVAAERDPAPFGTLDAVLHSASKAPPDDLRRLAAALEGRLVEGLGMTEHSGGLVTATTRADMRGETDAADVFASVGRPAADSEVRLVGADGTDLPPDGTTVGELLLRSPALMDGYWRRPDATREAFRDGWWRSGDLATIDPAGYVYVHDRRADLIVSGGMNVYPAEVERVVLGLEGVAEAKVVGAPHERWGQTVVACVVVAPGAHVTEEDVVSHCKRSLASYKKPTRVLFLERLPRTASQKVRTQELRELVSRRLA